jgi:hypothetical protein
MFSQCPVDPLGMFSDKTDFWTLMRNLRDNRRRDQINVTFPQLTLHRGKDRVHFCTGFFQKENIVYAGAQQIFHTKNR